jgi:RES domain-containing protein
LSLSIVTAVREANQAGSLQPTTLVSYEAEIEGLFDCRDDLALQAEGMDAAALADSTWRDQMRLKGEATTQTFARRLIASGHPGLLVRSFAPGAAADDLNMVLWKWGNRAPSRLELRTPVVTSPRRGKQSGRSSGHSLDLPGECR